MAFGRSAIYLSLALTLTATLAAPALADNPYAAIAASPSTGAAADAYNFSTQFAANSRAISICNRSTGGNNDCTAVVAVHTHLCGALVRDSSSGRWGRGVGNTKQDAINAANNNLGSFNGQLVRWVCNGTTTASKSTGTSTTEAAVAGLLVGAAAVAIATHHRAPGATPAPVAYVPAPALQGQAYVPAQQAQTYVPVAPQTVTATSGGYVPVAAARPLALVGLRVHRSDVINAIVPIYAGFGAGNALAAPVLGQIAGGAGGAESVFQPAGYVVTGLDVYRGSYKGNDEVMGLRIYWNRTTPSGLDPAGAIMSDVMATNAPPNLTAKTLRAAAGAYISNIVITPSTHADGSTYVHDIDIVTTPL